MLDNTAQTHQRGSTDPRSLRTQQSIRTAVVDLYSTSGADRSPTLTDIADRAGVSRRAVYKNFGSLDDAVLDTFVGILADTFPTPVAEAGDISPDAPSRLFTRLADFLAAHANFYRSVLTGPSAFRATTAVRDKFSTSTRALLRTSSDEQVDDAHVDFVLFGTMGVCTQVLSAHEGASTDELSAALRCALGATMLRVNGNWFRS